MPTVSSQIGQPLVGSEARRRILVDNGSYGMQNHGDVAMLRVAVERLGELWPNSEIFVITDRPDRLRRAVPRAIPVPTYGYLLGALHLPLSTAENLVLRNHPSLSVLVIKSIATLAPATGRRRNLLQYRDMISQMDLVVTSGGGYLTDDFHFYANPILDTLEIAADLGKPTAALGQGIGPFSRSGPLYVRAQQVLPRLNRILIREVVSCHKLLDDLNVTPSRVRATGDDAIELANRFRPDTPGSALGVNVRQTSYTNVDATIAREIGGIVRRAADRYRAPILPLPISMSKNESDHRSIRNLIIAGGIASDGGKNLTTVESLVAQIVQCRVVVTAAYHAAVFALSCGIPAVCLAKSKYYATKHMGLADQFGNGCVIVHLDQPGYPAALEAAIHEAWRTADEARPALLAAAERQIATGRAAYRELYQMVEAGSGARLS